MGRPPMGDRLAVSGPIYPDGKPMGSRCREECRRPVAGTAEAHCMSCHNAFSSIGFFDDHRQEGWCLKPSSLGLVPAAGLWATPEGHANRRVIAERFALSRAGKMSAA